MITTKNSSTVAPTLGGEQTNKQKALTPKQQSQLNKQSSPSSYLIPLSENIFSAGLRGNPVTQLFYATDTTISPSWDWASPRLQKEKLASNKISLRLQVPQTWSPADSNQ